MLPVHGHQRQTVIVQEQKAAVPIDHAFIARRRSVFDDGTSLGEHGEILYDCPIEINDKADLENYGITWEDCRFLHFNGSQRMRVYFFKTDNRELAEAQWSYLDTLHSSGFASMRCMVPGRKKPYIKCPTTNSCARCPYGRKPEDKQAPVISLDEMVETGYEPAASASPEESAVTKSEYDSIKAVMDIEDPHIAQAFEMKELLGFSVKEIAAELDLSEPRIYQLVARARVIGREYRQKNG